MIEKILGVVCIVGAGMMYTVERASMVNHQNGNYFIIPLILFGALNLVVAYVSSFLQWWNTIELDKEPALEEQPSES